MHSKCANLLIIFFFNSIPLIQQNLYFALQTAYLQFIYDTEIIKINIMNTESIGLRHVMQN